MNDYVIPEIDNDISASTEDAKKVSTSKTDWYKGEKDKTDALAIVNFSSRDVSFLRSALSKKPDLTEDEKRQVIAAGRKKVAEALGKDVDQLDPIDLLDLSECRFKAVSGSFKEGIGYVAWPKNMTAEEQKLYVESKVGPRKDYVTTIVVVYPVDDEGEIDMERLTKTKEGRLVESFKVMPWRMSTDKYHDLVRINKKLTKGQRSLADTDLVVQCTDKVFQKLKIDDDASHPSAWRSHPMVKRAVLERALKLQDKLEPFRRMSVEDLKEKLGIATASSSTSDSDVDPDFMSKLEGV